MENRGLRVLGLLLALAITLTVGALLGGVLVFGLSQIDSLLPSAQAQAADPGYGLVIAVVEPGAPAESAGLVRGDILLEVDGQALKSFEDLLGVLGGLEPGTRVELAVLHGDDERSLVATLADRDGRAFLGIVPCGGLEIEKEIEREITVTIDGSGAVIVEVVPGGPADIAGVQAGDVVLDVDGQELDSEHDLASAIAAYEPGDTVTLKIERPGQDQPVELSVTLSEHSDKIGIAYLGVRYQSMPNMEMLRGLPGGEHQEFDFDDLPFELPEGEFHFDMPFDAPGGELRQGALVRSVEGGSPAADAGLAEGDVITGIDGAAVEGPEALAEAISQRAPGDSISLTVFRPDADTELDKTIILGVHPEEQDKAYLGVTVGGFFRLQRFRGGEESLPPGEFEFPFHFELPFEREFEFRWPPGHSECPGGPGCSDNSV